MSTLIPHKYILAETDKGVLYRVIYINSINLIYKLNSSTLCIESFTSIEKVEKRQVELLRLLNPTFSIEVVKKCNCSSFCNNNECYEGILRANGKGLPINLKGIKWKLRSRFLNRCVVKVSKSGVWNYPLFPQLTHLLPQEECGIDVVYDSDQGVAHEY